MNIFDFVTQEEIDALPEDARAAFGEIVRIASSRLTGEVSRHDVDDNNGWEAINEARHGFMNTLIGVAKSYDVEPFASLEIPDIKDFGPDDHRRFKARLDHYMAQLVIGNSLRGQRASVKIAENVKDDIRGYIHGLKGAIDASDLTEGKKASLRSKLAAFEAELDKRRVNLMALTYLIVDLLGQPGAVWASYELVQALTKKTITAVHEQKSIEDEERALAMPAPIKQITDARISAPPPPPPRPTGPRESYDLNDGIPF